MKQWILITAWLSGICYLNAQQCGFYGLNAFVLNVHKSDSPEKIKGLKIYLVDENQKVYPLSPPWNDHGRQSPPQSMLFWDNANPHLRPQNSYPISSLHCEGADANYMILLQALEDYAQQPSRTPVYQALVVDEDGQKNGGYFPTRCFRLDYGRSINLCNNHFVEANSRNIPMQCVDAKPYKPIEIILDGPMPASPVSAEGLLYNIKVDSIWSPYHESDRYAVQQIEIKSYKTLELVQTIAIPAPYYLPQKYLKRLLEFGDFYADNPPGFQDFKIIADQYRDSNGIFQVRYWHFVYEPDLGIFELDSLLSNYYNVDIRLKNNQIERHERTETPTENIYRCYILENHQWVLQDTLIRKKTADPEDSPPSRTTPPLKTTECVQWIGSSTHNLPVFVQKNKEDNTFSVRDTFRFINKCDIPLNLGNINSATPFAFSISKRVAPLDTGYIYFNERLNYFQSDKPFFTQFSVSINTPGDLCANVQIRCTLISATAAEQTDFRHECPELCYELTLDDACKPLAYGLKFRETNERLGTWQFWDKNGTEHTETYSKQLNIKTDTITTKLMVRENAEWIQAFSWISPQGMSFFVKENTDSIKVFTDTSSNTFRFNYQHLVHAANYDIPLIPHDAPFLRSGYINVPLTFQPDCYAIIWNWSNLKSQFPDLVYPDISLLTSKLAEKYPGTKAFSVFNTGVLNALDLSGILEKNRQLVLQQLLEEPSIAHLSQLLFLSGRGPTYCDGHVYLEYSPYAPISEVIEMIEPLGFRMESYGSYGGNGHLMEYKAKLLDLSFTEHFNQFFTNPKALSGGLNLYMNVTPEREKMTSEK